MTEKELKLAFWEFDNAFKNIKLTEFYGFETQIVAYEFLSKGEKTKDADKIDVLFQNDFIEETYYDFLFNKKDIEQTLKKLNKWHYNLINDNQDSINWDDIIYCENTDNLQNIIIFHQNIMSDEVYWKTIGHCYTSSSLGHSNKSVISKYLNGKRANRHFLMEESERTFLNNLPEQITIYRGCSKKEIISKKLRCSWTLDKKVAKSFAFEKNHLNPLEKKNKSDFDVIEKTINKSEVIAYFNGRQESEILYFAKQ